LALGGTALAGAGAAFGGASRAVRSFGVCLAPAEVERHPELLGLVQPAGVTTVWLAGFFYGHKPYSADLLERARRRVEAAGLIAHLVNVPLGHPGDSLGAQEGGFPLTPPQHWQPGRRPDGTVYAGTSWHPPATAENVAALREQRRQGFGRCFLDDDFRLARGPGDIGGCYCAQHRADFLRAGGFGETRWEELIEDVRGRRDTVLLRAWLEFVGGELTASFRAQQRAFGGGLGIMVMYLGAEKAGIRLRDYRGVPLRVGEGMFDDGSFGSIKGKTDELFSALFHRRFVAPERAYSETTAYPADRLSAANLAAKLAVSTLADVRHTTFMSGLTPFPAEHWARLGPAMRAHARWHEELAGLRPQGPFRHYWGEVERRVGTDQPFSLWLAVGVPFQVVENAGTGGWTFLADFDARALGAGEKGGRDWVRGWRVCRPSAGVRGEVAEPVEESLAALFELKRRLRPALRDFPVIEEDEPAVCAWYPEAGKVAIWNLMEEPRTLTVTRGVRRREVRLGPLGFAVLTDAAYRGRASTAGHWRR
jgi:hypothetical protein